MKKSLLSLIAVAALSGCTIGAESVLVAVGAAGGIISSMTSSPDYTKYADTCKEIIQAGRDAYKADSDVLVNLTQHIEMRSQVLLYMAMRPKVDTVMQCALALPKGFLQQLAESGNILNFVATVYGVNRESINNRKAIEANKELSLAQQQNVLEAQRLQNQLLTQLAGNSITTIQETSNAINANK